MKKRKVILISFLLVLLASIGVGRWCMERKPSSDVSMTDAKKADYYYCAMHPWFHQDHPGNCGICGMTLVKKGGGTVSGADSASAGPAGLPESLKGLAPVDLSPFKQQLIGLRTSVVEEKPVVRVIRTVGRYAGGQGDFAAQGRVASGKRRHAVADIYALDIPYVRVGQKAWVSAFSGSGPRWEGLVSRIYPYDGTQSPIRRVQISLPHAPSSELFSNVEIKADSQPLLSVPADAVMATGLHHYVFVKKSADIFVPEEITVGFEGDDRWQVLSGLNAGETVVEGANFMVDADSKLEANFAAMESQEK
ncbi:MAG TPA: heavy metal-binding domain-containing protein [bacterium]|jgi:hypothetical protein|nr:heavy metal-binding domain-containing protein [bacterium]